MNAKTKVATIVVNKTEAKKASFRGARAAWLAELVKYDGKPLDSFCTAVQKEPPSTPKTGKFAGKCEPPMGWIRFFVRQGLIQIQDK